MTDKPGSNEDNSKRQEATTLHNEKVMPQEITKYCTHCDRASRWWDTICHVCHYFPEASLASVQRYQNWGQWVASWEPSVTRAPKFYEEKVEDSSSVLKTFACFNRLPVEIRLQIWSAALPGPRIVYLYPLPLKSHQKTFNPKVFGNFRTFSTSIKSGYGWKSPSSIDIMYVCQEAYGVMSGNYVRAFGTNDAFPQTWFNFDIDTLYLDWRGLDGQDSMSFLYGPLTIWSPDFENVHRLAIYHEGNHPFPYFHLEVPGLGVLENHFHQTMYRFPNVTIYTIVHRRYESRQSGDLTLIDIVNIDSLLAFCSQPFDPTGKAAERYDESWGRYYWQLRGSLHISNNMLLNLPRALRSLESCLGEWGHSLPGRSRDSGSYIMPSIEYKLATTPAMAARIENACKDYRRKRIAYKRSKATNPPRQPLLSDDIPLKQESD